MLLLPPTTLWLWLLAALHAATSEAAAAAPTTTVNHIAPATNSSQNTSAACVERYQPPNIRYPPTPLVDRTDNNTMTFSQPTPWEPPPQSYLWSPYAMTHSTRPFYQTLLNMQATHYPLFPQSSTWPPGSQIDIVSWSSHNGSSSGSGVVTVFGYFAPVNGSIAAWLYSSTGPLANVTNLWAVIGWGVDDEGVAYRVDYETGYQVAGGQKSDAKPCINVASRKVDGPSVKTYAEIVDGLMSVGTMAGDLDFVKLVGGLRKLKSDGRRDGLREIDCDEACVMNRDLIPG